MAKFRRLVVLPVAAALVFALAGCGPRMTKVAGKVTYKGKPVTGGTLVLTPTSGSAAPVTVDLNANGEFETKAPAVEVRITVDNRNLKNTDKGPIGASGDYSMREKDSGPGIRPPNAPGGGGGGGGHGPRQMPQNNEAFEKAKAERGAPTLTGKTGVGTYMDIPKKYYKGETTDLIRTIKPGEPLDLELKD